MAILPSLAFGNESCLLLPDFPEIHQTRPRLARSRAFEKVLDFFFAENQGEFTAQGPLVLPRRRGMNQPGLDGLIEKYPQQGSRFEALVDQQPNAPLRNILDPGRIADLLAGYSLPKCAHIGGRAGPSASLGWGGRHVSCLPWHCNVKRQPVPI